MSEEYVFNNRVIVAQETGTNGACTGCRLSLKYNSLRSRAMISLRLRAEFEECDTTQDVMLQLSPDIVQCMDIDFNLQPIPQQIKQHLRESTALSAMDQALVFSLTLSSPGRLIVPGDVTTFTPINAHQARIQNFQRLCQATRLLFYIPSPNLPPRRRQALEDFAKLASVGSLAPAHTDLRRFQRGQGGREAGWDLFRFSEPPPTYEQQAEQTGSKHARADSPVHRTDARTKRRLRPSIVLNSDSETDFSHLALSPAAANFTQHGTLGHGKEMREALHAELAVMLPDIVQSVLRDILQDMVPNVLYDVLLSSNGGIGPMQDDATTTGSPSPLIDRIVEPLVTERLPQVVQEYIELDDPLENYTVGAESMIREAAEDAVLELRLVKEESISEIKAVEDEVMERLAEMDWNGGSERSQQMGAATCPAAPLGPGLGPGLGPSSESGTQSCRSARQRHWTSTPDVQRDATLPPSQVSTTMDTEDESVGEAVGIPSDHIHSHSTSRFEYTSRQNSAIKSPTPHSQGSSGNFQLLKTSQEDRPSTGSRMEANCDMKSVDGDRVEDLPKAQRDPSRIMWLESHQYATTEPDESDQSSPGSGGMGENG